MRGEGHRPVLCPTCYCVSLLFPLYFTEILPAIVQEAGKQRYVFFSFPHIAINSKGEIGALSRPGQDATSSACGALIAALGQFKAEGLEKHVLEPGGRSHKPGWK